MTKSSVLPVLELRGTPHEMGFQFGSACQAQIGRQLQANLEIINSQKPLTMDAVVSDARAYVAPVEEFAPHLLEEVRGIADGAGISFEEAFSLQVFAEIAFSQTSDACQRCTGFAISAMASSDGNSFLGQNVDSLPSLESLVCVVRRIPTDGPRSLMVSYAGLIAYIGINSEGLGMTINQLVSPGHRIGVPILFLMRRFFECGSIAEWLAVLERTEIASSLNYIVADRDAIADVETTTLSHAVLRGDGGFLIHSNHYLHPEFLSEERLLPELPDSVDRYKRLGALLNAVERPYTVQALHQLLRDHDNYPESICRHLRPGDGGDLGRAMKTCFSAIHEPAQGRMHVAHGNPCENEYVRYEL